mmetsp:Transcript_45143/g.142126  ORF Transcript_45143/g.142126 Transcript_45143/m.142126 type:complete len:90 (+) Transcript_45143:403-672(+)
MKPSHMTLIRVPNNFATSQFLFFVEDGCDSSLPMGNQTRGHPYAHPNLAWYILSNIQKLSFLIRLSHRGANRHGCPLCRRYLMRLSALL